MLSKQATLALLAVTLFGCLGGIIATLTHPVLYQAQAYVAVYAMPKGLDGFIGQDEATQIRDIYQLSATERQVLQQARGKIPAYSYDDIRQNIRVELVAYTPYTRITATDKTARGAVMLANAVASAWVGTASIMNDTLAETIKSHLEERESELSDRIAIAQQSLAEAKPSSPLAIALNTEIQTFQDSYNKADTALQGLDDARKDMVGNAYWIAPATESTAVPTPNAMKNLIMGAAVGASVGLLLMFWLTMGRWNRTQKRASSSFKTATQPTVGQEASDG